MDDATASLVPALRTADIPRATYRVQLHRGFRFTDACAAVPYLASLGISHLYASPLLKARPGSMHGYDVVDAGEINPEIGSEEDFAQLCHTLDAHGMKLLLDIVPNHMGVLEADNAWWMDVLENGPAASHARSFDIEWAPPQRELNGKLLLAVLGQPYGQALEAGELKLVFEPGRGQFVLHYFDHRFPIDSSDHAGLLSGLALPQAAQPAQRRQIGALLQAFRQLPPRGVPDAEGRALRQRESAALKQQLSEFHAAVEWAPAWFDACAARWAGVEGVPESFDDLDRLLQRQAFRLAHWRTAGDEINYRRFFDINGLAALRMEEPAVFDAAHRRVLEWVGQGRVAGLRIDHPDGMADPGAYFQRLQQACLEARVAQGQPADATYVVIEKILADGEPWRRDWPVQGDTGYRFSNQANGVFVDESAADAFDALYAAFVDGAVDYDAELDAAKRHIMAVSLAADLRLLTEQAVEIALAQRYTRDLTRNGLKAAIVEFAAAFDVYRSYVGPRGVAPLDRAKIEQCAAAARARCRPSHAASVEFVRQLMLQSAEETQTELRTKKLRFVQRFQQFTAPVMAKAMEDTAFYRYHRLVSLNDVGGDPRHFGTSVSAFHAANQTRLRDMPHTLLGGSTHDSKRSEDVRCRLDVLSEMPQKWSDTLMRWRELAQTQWRIGGMTALPHPNDEMLLFQTLLGIWPTVRVDEEALAALRGRIGAYMLKAVREAKQQSSWLDGDDGYEAIVQRSIDVLLARTDPNPFLTDLNRFVGEIAPFGASNSLALVTLKLSSPGVPDIYQGCEDWFFALVDPDNRQPVDFAGALERRDSAAALAAHGTGALSLRRWPLPDGPHKRLVTRRLLQWRQAAEALFRDGDYRPLTVRGSMSEHVLAFARCDAAHCSVTVVARLGWRATQGDIDAWIEGRCWGDTVVELPDWHGMTRIAPMMWDDVLVDRRMAAFTQDEPSVAGEASGEGSPRRCVLRVSEVLDGLPVAVLRPSGRSW